MRNDSTTASDPAAAAVSSVLDQLYQAWAAADADGIASLYTEDATVVMPGVWHRSRSDVRAFFAAGFAGRLARSAAADESRTVTFAGPDTAIVISEGGILMPGETSVPAGRLVRATWVLVRQPEPAGDRAPRPAPDGSWRIAAYHNCPLHPVTG
jgi:uncharacterized protein (TIGR02246 family)